MCGVERFLAFLKNERWSKRAKNVGSSAPFFCATYKGLLAGGLNTPEANRLEDKEFNLLGSNGPCEVSDRSQERDINTWLRAFRAHSVASSELRFYCSQPCEPPSRRLDGGARFAKHHHKSCRHLLQCRPD